MSAAQHATPGGQLPLLRTGSPTPPRPRPVPRRGMATLLCAACRSREARYGFRDREREEGKHDRPRTLCFACFRLEIERRQASAAPAAPVAVRQARLPLEETLRALSLRRRRAQIAARHALEDAPPS